MIFRRKTRTIKIGNVIIGGNEPIAVQSMLTVSPADTAAAVEQAGRLREAGCNLIRVAVPNAEAALGIAKLKAAVDVPIVADIHFDYRLALESVECGADKIRINPGNIGSTDRVREVADKCRSYGVPIRVGVNSGSVAKDILARYGGPTPEAMAESAFYNVRLLEFCDFSDIVISLKSSDVRNTIAAYEAMAPKCDYPFHLGVTEAGTERMGIIKSAMGIGALLARGIGDTIRVSLTADPVREVQAGYDILRAAGLYNKGVEIISCPTCGRCSIDLIELTGKLEEALSGLNLETPLKVAVMGCAVNGPGEAREADIGIAGAGAAGGGEALLFKKGKPVRRIPQSDIVAELLEEIRKMQV